jgi:dihydroxyacetone kinase-like protein
MSRDLHAALIDATAAAISAAADELTRLDQAIGDGDHGLNLRRGFEAVLAQLDSLTAKPLPDAIKTLGNVLVMKVGGASGPLYGTLFMMLSKELPPQPDLADAQRALAGAIEAVKRIGKSDVGQKTMLDVLVPVLEEVELGNADRRLGQRVKARAAAAARATIPMLAIKGRASFLGARSIGHMDPGARSSWLMIEALCDALEG